MTKQQLERREKLKMTILRRRGGKWTQDELFVLMKGTGSQVSSHQTYPEFLILPGYQSVESMFKIVGKHDFTVQNVKGISKCPFVPGFA